MKKKLLINSVLKRLCIQMLEGMLTMSENYSLDDLPKKAHEINCLLSDGNFSPREIEIIGYYLRRIATSYLSYETHQQLAFDSTTVTEPSEEKSIGHKLYL